VLPKSTMHDAIEVLNGIIHCYEPFDAVAAMCTHGCCTVHNHLYTIVSNLKTSQASFGCFVSTDVANSIVVRHSTHLSTRPRV
jgi:hypothetical protein